MKKIINGKCYSTDKAREVFVIGHGGSSFRDFSYYVETLYCKRTGEYFLYGKGGPASKYAETVGRDMRTGGDKIIPLTLAQAQAWAEREMDGDDYEAEFGVIDDDECGTFSFGLDIVTAAKIRKAAQDAGVSISEIIASKF